MSARMSRTGRRDTAAERRLRSELHRRGLRYRVDVPIPSSGRRRVDILFPGAKVAVFVHGCFWHLCPEHGNLPKANADFWRAKLQANRARDANSVDQLEAAGYRVIIVWEHEDPMRAADRIALAVRAPVPSSLPQRGSTARPAAMRTPNATSGALR